MDVKRYTRDMWNDPTKITEYAAYKREPGNTGCSTKPSGFEKAFSGDDLPSVGNEVNDYEVGGYSKSDGGLDYTNSYKVTNWK